MLALPSLVCSTAALTLPIKEEPITTTPKPIKACLARLASSEEMKVLTFL
jgi:hypothetical protein